MKPEYVAIYEPEASGHRVALYCSVLVNGLCGAGRKVVFVSSDLGIDFAINNFPDDVEYINALALKTNFKGGYLARLFNSAARYFNFLVSALRIKKKYGNIKIIVPFFDDVAIFYFLFGVVGLRVSGVTGIILKDKYIRGGYGRWVRNIWFFIIKTILSWRKTNGLFYIDKLAQESISQRLHGHGKEKFFYLPDIGSSSRVVSHEKGHARQRLGIKSCDARVFLVFGAISMRKGIKYIFELLSARGSNSYFVFAGKVDAEVMDYIDKNFGKLKNNLIIFDGFVSPNDVDLFFSAADYIWLLYCDFEHSSGVLIQAAEYGKLVVVGNSGVMSDLVRENGIGISIDPAHIGLNLYDFDGFNSSDYDLAINDFVLRHSPRVFASLVCSVVLR